MGIIKDRIDAYRKGAYSVPSKGKALQRADPSISDSETRIYDITHSNTENLTEATNIAKELGFNQIYGGDLSALQHAKELEEARKNRMMAEQQGVMTKIGNAVIQTAGEVALGTLSGIFRLADLAVYGIQTSQGKEYDFHNAIADQFDEWNEAIRNDIAPVHSYGTDFGYFMQQMPTVGVIASFVVPTKLGTGLLSMGVKSLRAMKSAAGINWSIASKIANIAAKSKASRELRELNSALKIAEAEGRTIDASRLVDKIRRFNQIGDNGVSAGVNIARAKSLINVENKAKLASDSLIGSYLWNISEAKNNYDLTYEERKAQLDELSDKEREQFFINNPQFVGMSNDEIAKHMAHDVASSTFWQDTGLFAVTGFLMTKAASKLMGQKSFMGAGAPLSRRGERLLQQELNRQLGKDVAGDAGRFLLSDLIPTATQGKHFLNEAVSNVINVGGRHILADIRRGDPDEYFGRVNSRRVSDYLDDAEIWSSAFWALIGGIGFGKVKKGIEAAQRNIPALWKYKVGTKTDSGERVKISEEEYNTLRMSSERQRIEKLKKMGNNFDKFVDRINKIEEGKNPFKLALDDKNKPVNDENGNPMLEFIVDEADKDYWKDLAFSDFIQDTVLDAVDSGNYDLLKEWFTNEELQNMFAQKIPGYDKATERSIGQKIVDEAEYIYKDYVDTIAEFTDVANDKYLYDTKIIESRNNPFVIRQAARNLVRAKRRLESSQRGRDKANAMFDNELGGLTQATSIYNYMLGLGINKYRQWIKSEIDRLTKLLDEDNIGKDVIQLQIDGYKRKLLTLHDMLFSEVDEATALAKMLDDTRYIDALKDATKLSKYKTLEEFRDEKGEEFTELDKLSSEYKKLQDEFDDIEAEENTEENNNKLNDIKKKLKDLQTKITTEENRIANVIMSDSTFNALDFKLGTFLESGMKVPSYLTLGKSAEAAYNELTLSQKDAIDAKRAYDLGIALDETEVPTTRSEIKRVYSDMMIQLDGYVLNRLMKYGDVIEKYFRKSKSIEELLERQDKLSRGEIVDGENEKDLRDAVDALSLVAGSGSSFFKMIVDKAFNITKEELLEREIQKKKDINDDSVTEAQETHSEQVAGEDGEPVEIEAPEKVVQVDENKQGDDAGLQKEEDSTQPSDDDAKGLRTKGRNVEENMTQRLIELNKIGFISLKDLAAKPFNSPEIINIIEQLASEAQDAERELYNRPYAEYEKYARKVVKDMMMIVNATSQDRSVREFMTGMKMEETPVDDGHGGTIMQSIFRYIDEPERQKMFETIVNEYLQAHGTDPVTVTENGVLKTKRYVDISKLISYITNNSNLSYNDAFLLLKSLNNMIGIYRDKGNYLFVNYNRSWLSNPEKFIDDLFTKKVLDTAETYRISKPTMFGKHWTILKSEFERTGFKSIADRITNAKTADDVFKHIMQYVYAGKTKIYIKSDKRGIHFYTKIGLEYNKIIENDEEVEKANPIFEDSNNTNNLPEIEIGYVDSVTKLPNGNGFKLGKYDANSTGIASQGFNYSIEKTANGLVSNVDILFNAFTNHIDPDCIALQQILLDLYNDKQAGGFSQQNIDRFKNNNIIKQLVDRSNGIPIYTGELIQARNATNGAIYWKRSVMGDNVFDVEKFIDDILSIRYHTSETTGTYGQDSLLNATDKEIQDSINEWKTRLYNDFSQTHYIQEELSTGKSPEVKLATTIDISYNSDETKPTKITKDLMAEQEKYNNTITSEEFKPFIIFSVNADSEGVSNVMKIEGNDEYQYNNSEFGVGNNAVRGIRAGIMLGSMTKDGVNRPIAMYFDRGNLMFSPDAKQSPIRQMIADELYSILYKKAANIKTDPNEIYEQLNALIGKTGLVYGLHVHKSDDRIFITDIDGNSILNIYSSANNGTVKTNQMLITYEDDSGRHSFYLQPFKDQKGFIPEATSDKPIGDYISNSIKSLVNLLLTGEHNGVKVREGVRYNLNYAMLSNQYSPNMYVERGLDDKGITFKFKNLAEDGKVSTLTYNSLLDYVVDNEAFSTNFQQQEVGFTNGTTAKTVIDITEIPIGSVNGKGLYLRLPQNAPKRTKAIAEGKRQPKRWGEKLSVDGTGENSLRDFMRTPLEEGGLGLSETSVNTLFGNGTSKVPRLIPDEITILGKGNVRQIQGTTGHYDDKTKRIYISALGLSEGDHTQGWDVLRTILHEGIHQKLRSRYGVNYRTRIQRNSEEIINVIKQAQDFLIENYDENNVNHQHSRYLINILSDVDRYFANYKEQIDKTIKDRMSDDYDKYNTEIKKLNSELNENKITREEYDNAVAKEKENIENKKSKLKKEYKSLYDIINSDEATKKAVLAEEIIVELMTDKYLANTLNDIEYIGDIDLRYTNKRQTLFQRIVHALIDFFGIKIKDDSILAKELELLSKDITDKGEIKDKKVKDTLKPPTSEDGVEKGNITPEKIAEIPNLFTDVKQSEDFDESHKYIVDGKEVTTSVTGKLNGSTRNEELGPDGKPIDGPSKIISTSGGNSVDKLAREYYRKNPFDYDNGEGRDFDEDPLLTRDNIESTLISINNGEGAFEDLRRKIANMVNEANGGTPTGFRIITDETPIAARWTNKTDPTDSEIVAGTPDMIVIDNNGNYYIIDFKTKRNLLEKGGLDNLTKSAYFAQVNHYRMMIESKNPALRGKFKGLKLAVFSANPYPLKDKSDNDIKYERGTNKGQVMLEGRDIKGDDTYGYYIDSNEALFIDVPISDASKYNITSYKDEVIKKSEVKPEEPKVEVKPEEIKKEEIPSKKDEVIDEEPDIDDIDIDNVDMRLSIARPKIISDDKIDISNIDADKVDLYKRNPTININGIRRTFSMENLSSGFPKDVKLLIADAVNRGIFNSYCE